MITQNELMRWARQTVITSMQLQAAKEAALAEQAKAVDDAMRLEKEMTECKAREIALDRELLAKAKLDAIVFVLEAYLGHELVNVSKPRLIALILEAEDQACLSPSALENWSDSQDDSLAVACASMPDLRGGFPCASWQEIENLYVRAFAKTFLYKDPSDPQFMDPPMRICLAPLSAEAIQEWKLYVKFRGIAARMEDI